MSSNQELKRAFLKADSELDSAVEQQEIKHALYWLGQKRAIREQLEELPELYGTEDQ